jgi:ATP-binding cassette subfamily C protein
MRHIFITLLSLLNRRDRWRFPLLGLLLTVNGALEMLGVGLIIPLIQLLNDPEGFLRNPIAARLYHLAGLAHPGQFIILAGTSFFLVVLFKAVWSAVVLRHQYRLLASEAAAVAKGLLGHYLVLPYEEVVQRNSAELIGNCEEAIQSAFPSALTAVCMLFAECIVLAGVLGVMFTVEPLICLVSGVLVGGALGLLYKVTRRQTEILGRARHTAYIDRLRALQQSLGSLKEVKVFGREEFFRQVFNRHADHTAQLACTYEVVQGLPRLAIEGLMVGSIVLVVIAVQLMERNTAEVTPILGMFAFGVFRLMPSANRILNAINVLRSMRGGLDRIRADLPAGSAEVVALQMAAPWPVPRQEIVVDQVSFAYRGTERSVLKDVSCRIGIGHSVGVVGLSGAGKSTLIDIILGLLRPSSGRVLVDGHDIAENPTGWQRHLGYVPQAIALMDDSVRRNIAFGIHDDEIDEEQVRKAVSMAQLDQLVATLPEGLDTMVGERGLRLSGGQRQRIGIARALYHGPEILVMDEATSALDGQTERDVIEAIDSLRGTKTILVIAHRLSTVRQCDSVVLMKEGRILDHGRFEELVGRNDEFRRMVALGELQGKLDKPAPPEPDQQLAKPSGS